MNIDITQIVIALIGLMSAVITSVIVPLVKAKTSANQQVIIASLSRTAVLAAQQMYDSDEGQKKKEYAVSYVAQLMKKHGVTLSSEEVGAAVEAAVKELKAVTPSELW